MSTIAVKPTFACDFVKSFEAAFGPWMPDETVLDSPDIDLSDPQMIQRAVKWWNNNCTFISLLAEVRTEEVCLDALNPKQWPDMRLQIMSIAHVAVLRLQASK